MVWSKHITESNYRGEVLSPRDPQPGGWGGSSLACRSIWMSDPRQDLPTAGALRGERVRSDSSPLNWLRMSPHRLPSLPPSLTAPRCARPYSSHPRSCSHVFCIPGIAPVFELSIHTLVFQTRRKIHGGQERGSFTAVYSVPKTWVSGKQEMTWMGLNRMSTRMHKQDSLGKVIALRVRNLLEQSSKHLSQRHTGIPRPALAPGFRTHGPR